MKYILIALSIVAFTACVSQKKYDELLANKIDLETDLAESRDSLETTVSKIARLEAELAKERAAVTATKKQLEDNQAKLATLNKQHDELETYYNNLLNNSGKLTRDLAEQQERLLTTKEDLERIKRENELLSKDLAVREQKVKELEEILANKDKAVQDLKNRVTNALLNFKENDLTVEVKNGKVYVSLAEQLLFNSGSIVVDSKGVSALQQLAKAIKDQQDINILVEGHTDNVPISRTSQYMTDNWDLSVLRATAIVKILTKAGLSADQVTAAGRGEFSPVGENDTKEGRQKNRRTEIIITPDLDELFSILESN